MSIKLFESKQIRSVWNEVEQQWYFSVVDIVEVLTDSINPTDYLKKMRKRDVGYFGSISATYFGLTVPPISVQTVPLFAAKVYRISV